MAKQIERKQARLSFDIESPMAIELRRILIRLNRELDLDRKRCLMITSSDRGEGKSLFSLNFALVLANHLRKRVLLVDGDMRRPVQHTVFNTDLSPGLAEALMDDQKPIITCSTHLPNLHFLPAGRAGDQPSTLLQERSIRNVFGRLKEDYDIILLDCPPVVPVSDPLQYVDISDGALYMVMAGRTPRDVVQRGVDILRSVGTNIIGLVANNLSEVLPYYYDHRYYGYGEGPRS